MKHVVNSSYTISWINRYSTVQHFRKLEKETSSNTKNLTIIRIINDLFFLIFDKKKSTSENDYITLK